MNKIHPNDAARWIGMISSVAVLGLWLAIILSKQPQYADLNAAGTWTIGRWIIDPVDAKMLLLSLLGVLATLAQSPLVMLPVFLLMFWPVGLYTLGVPGWAKLIGVLSLLFLLSGILMLSSRYRIIKIVQDK
jgi:hypothetical protein